MPGLTKSELISLLASQHPQLAVRDMDLAVKTILQAMTQTLSAGQRIEVRGFGSFSITKRDSRIGRNPKTGEIVVVPAKRVPHFKPGKDLRERVDQRQNSGQGRKAGNAGSSGGKTR